MTIDNTITRNLENKLRASIPEELKQYLLVKYAQEPFPYEYSEQDLYANIERDINAFESNTLDVTIKAPSERWQEEREYLQELYFEKSCETRELLEYVTELERLLSEHGLKSARMLEKRIALSDVV
jgi:hypothetical protein